MNYKFAAICIACVMTLALMIACQSGTPPQSPPSSAGQAPNGRPGDDQPIVVVGGSLHVSAQQGKWEKPADGHANHVHVGNPSNPSMRHVTQIDVVSEDQSIPPLPAVAVLSRKDLSKDVVIELTYGGKTVTLKTENQGQGLSLSGLPGIPVGSNGNVLSFDPSDGKLTSVKITDSDSTDPLKPFTCDKVQCTVIIHTSK